MKYTRKQGKLDKTQIKDKTIVYIKIQHGNVIITLTDLRGDVIDWFSSGSLGLKGFRKKSPMAAKQLALALFERTKNYSNKEFIIKIKGLNVIKKALLKYISSYSLNVIKMEELSGMPFNGCRPQKKRKL